MIPCPFRRLHAHGLAHPPDVASNATVTAGGRIIIHLHRYLSVCWMVISGQNRDTRNPRRRP